jgi:hypothetical protein
MGLILNRNYFNALAISLNPELLQQADKLQLAVDIEDDIEVPFL